MTVKMSTMVFWVATLCELVNVYCFRETCYLHFLFENVGKHLRDHMASQSGRPP
jgi:hypothetical protein